MSLKTIYAEVNAILSNDTLSLYEKGQHLYQLGRFAERDAKGLPRHVEAQRKVGRELIINGARMAHGLPY